ncbi:MAG: ThuA domain-containing protein [Croceibacterium sp.]
MKRALTLLLATLAIGAAPPAPAVRQPPPGYGDAYAGKKRVLLIADLSTGNQSAHMAVSHAAAVIEQIGRDSGAYVTFIRTDTDWVTKRETWGKADYAQGGSKQARGKNLDYFDAVVFYTNGELELDTEQKQALLDFVRQDGKGFVGIHTAAATAYAWPEYGEMLGGVFDNHPWMIADARIVVERPEFPAMAAFTSGMTLRDEHYQMRAEPFSRAKVDVLARIDPRSVDLTAPMVHRTDADFPVAWIRQYGKGRVFYSGLGHTDASWDDPRIRTMMREAITWAVSGTEQAKPHPVTPLP